MASSSSSSSGGVVAERRGIPGAQFVEDVHTYLTQSGLDVNSALAFLQERFACFSFLLSGFRLFSSKLSGFLLLFPTDDDLGHIIHCFSLMGFFDFVKIKSH